MFCCWHAVLLKNSCPALLRMPSFSKLPALFDLPGLWQLHNKETCDMNQRYTSVSQRMQVMEIPVIGYYWTSGNLGLGKRSSYQSRCSKQRPFFVPLKPLIAMAVMFRPQFWDHPRGVKEAVWSIWIILQTWAFVGFKSDQDLQKVISAVHFRNIPTIFSQEATALIFCNSCATCSQSLLLLHSV